jgi:hypothetical protein
VRCRTKNERIGTGTGTSEYGVRYRTYLGTLMEKGLQEKGRASCDTSVKTRIDTKSLESQNALRTSLSIKSLGALYFLWRVSFHK